MKSLGKSSLTLVLFFFLAFALKASEGGQSNYIPGFYGDLGIALEPPEGFSIRNDAWYYSGEASPSIRSGAIQADADLSLAYNYLTVLYNPGVDLESFRLAFAVTMAVGHADLDVDLQVGPINTGIDDDRLGLGDTTLHMYVYWKKNNFNLAWANYLVTPTGTYDEDDLANTGLNYWTFETDLMLTYFNEETGQDYSLVIGYGYNTENKDTNYKTGDEFHIDYVANQFLTEKFAVGINGFYFRQLSGDSGSGARLGSFKGEASGIGPALYYIANVSGKDVYLTCKWLHEFDTENRLKGDHVYLAFALSF